jgi:sialate O-acetylesterase
MILPYSEGPMALSGFLWYQGEANTQSQSTATDYACLFPAMIRAWRQAFLQPELFFAFVQLSTWCSAADPASLPQMRDAQMSALSLPNVAYATNADHGDGCNIHPKEKQWVAARLATAARALVYNHSVQWRSPSYKSAKALTAPATASSTSATTVGLTIELNDGGESGLHTVYPYNLRGSYNVDIPAGLPNPPNIVDCSSSFPINATANASMALQCAWASLEVEGHGWVNASIGIVGGSVRLTADLPTMPLGFGALPAVLGSAYGYGPIPMLTIYDIETGLPVLPWNKSL